MSVSETILLVEDEPMLRNLLSEVLQDDGFAVGEASSGDHAWQMIEQGFAFDVLLTDVRMPGKIDGLELARKVKSARVATPIIVMSGHIGDDELEPGLAAFLPKPFAPSVIASMIKGLGAH